MWVKIPRYALIFQFKIHCCRIGKPVWNIEPNSDCFDTLTDFYRYILENMAIEDTLIVGHKITAAHTSVADLLELVPELQVLYIVRDPRDVIISALGRQHNTDIFKLIIRWRDSLQIMRRLSKQPDFKDCLIIIRYEDLLTKTAETLQKLSEFLQVPFIEIPSELYDYGQKWNGNSSFGKIEQVIDPSPIGQWHRANPKMAELVEVLLFELIAAEGYELNKDITPLSKIGYKIRYWLHQFIIQLQSVTILLERAIGKFARSLADF